MDYDNYYRHVQMYSWVFTIYKAFWVQIYVKIGRKKLLYFLLCTLIDT